jgi:hypothetical protein
MSSLDMNGPFHLSEPEIDRKIEVGSIGNYALGFINENDHFIPKYVGRSDDDLNSRLKDWVPKYSKFKFSTATTKKRAFEEECRNYHDFIKQLDNKIHPDRPDGTDWSCPYCTNFDE